MRVADHTHLLCRPDQPIRDVMSRLQAGSVISQIFQIVVDADGHLLGTVTDGDVRRAILRGVGIDDPAQACMNANPTTGTDNDPHGNRDKLQAVKFLPIVDGANRLVEVHVLTDRDVGMTTALVMAGGFGTRLGESTRNTPKPLLPVGDKPILEHILTRLEDAGIPSIFVAGHYLHEQVESFLEARNSRAQIRYIHEVSKLGTAGALGCLPDDLPDPVLVINGDVLTQVDLGALEEFHRHNGYDGTVAVASHEIEVPFGVIRHDADGVFSGIEEKPRIREFVAAGLYYLGQEFRNLVPPEQPIDMPDLLSLGHNHGLKIGLFPVHEYWIDVGRPADLATAENDHHTRATKT